MGWKDWPYWVRGAIVGSVLSLLLLLILSFNPVVPLCATENFSCTSLYGLDAFLFNVQDMIHFADRIFIFIILPALLGGCFTGWLYGKIKNRKASS